jgi:hypothetical protein
MSTKLRSIVMFVVVLGVGAKRAEAEMKPEDPYMVPEDPYADPPVAAPSKPVASTLTVTPIIPIVTPIIVPELEPIRLAPPQHTIDGPITFAGVTVFPSGPLPKPFDRDPTLVAGYVCDVSGVLGSYFDIDGCRPATIRDNSFDDTSPELAAAIRAEYPEPSISFWAAHGWKLMASGLGLLAIASIIRRRRRHARRRAELASRRTQFQMSAIDPSVAEQHVAAWERGPTIVPTAIAPSMVAAPAPRRRIAAGTDQPPIEGAPDPDNVPAAGCREAAPAPAHWYQPSPEPPAPYPLTFPAFPEIPHEMPHAAQTVMLEQYRWEASVVQAVDDEAPTARGQHYSYLEHGQDYAIAFPRGSQNDELEQTRAHIERISRAETVRAETVLAYPPEPPQPRPSRMTIRSHVPKR